jgi:response regulator RpfG family c-di-GMP phosphodiesterase
MRTKNQIKFAGHSQELLDWLSARLPKAGFEVGREIESPQLVVFDGTSSLQNETELLDRLKLIVTTYPGVPVLFLFGQDHAMPFGTIAGLGITDFYQMPFEIEALIVAIHEKLPAQLDARDMTIESLARVGMADMDSEEPLPFDLYVYLPSVKRAIVLRRKGDKLDSDVRKRFEDHPHIPLYVKHAEISTFRSMQVEKLKDAYSSASGSARVDRLKQEARKVFSSLFTAQPQSDAEAQQLLETTRAIALEFVQQIQPGRNLREFLRSFGGQPQSNYSHVVNCAAYTVIFGAMLGVEDLASLSMGGLLHDVGLSVLPFNVALKAEGDMTAEDSQEFRIHPYYSIDVLNRRKIPLSVTVQKMILQHHELPDGTGYPNGVKSHEIHPFAKILMMADVFDELTRVTLGQPARSPQQAVHLIAGTTPNASVPPLPFFEQEIHGVICTALAGGEIFANSEPNRLIADQLKNHLEAPGLGRKDESGANVLVNSPIDPKAA